MVISKYDLIIDRYATEFSLDNILIKALIQTESSFKERAYRFEQGFYDRYIKGKTAFLSHRFYNYPKIIAASYGLCQIMYTTAGELGFVSVDPELLYDADANIKLGCKLLAKKIKKYGLELGILSYNSGSPRGKDPKLESNYIYLQKIAKNYKKFGGTNEEILKHGGKI